MKLDEINWNNFKSNYDVFKYKYEHPQSVVQAYHFGEWVEYEDSEIPCLSFLSNIKYRIKPVQEYRPYTEVKEEWIGKKVQRLDEYNCGAIFVINGIAPDSNNVFTNSWINLENLFNTHIWGNNGDENNGKPFGEAI